MPTDFFNSAHCKSRSHCVACRTEADWRESLQRAGLVETVGFGCPHGITAETAPAIQAEAMSKLPQPNPSFDQITEEAKAKAKAQLEEQGRTVWAWLHSNAENDSLTTERLTKEFLPMIPAFGCSCKKEWQEILERNPLPATGQAQWAIQRHNDVNRKLGKPIWP